MFRYILLFSFLIFFGNLNAQDKEKPKDSTQVVEKSKVLADTVKQNEIVSDTIPPLPKPKIIPKNSTSNKEEPAQKEEYVEPKIIYYQTVDGHDNWRNRKVKRRERHHGRNKIHTLTGRSRHGGGFGAISFKSTELLDESIVMAGLRGGWIINRTLGIGFEGYGIIPTATIPNIDNVDVMPIGGYGGLFLELIFFSNQVIHVTFPVSSGAGWLGYYEDGGNNFSNFTNDQIADDVFWYVEPGVDLEVNIARNFRLAGGVSKRFTQDLILPETTDDDFSTLSYFLTLKIGSF